MNFSYKFEQLTPGLKQIGKMLIFFLFANHLFACLWFLQANLQDFDKTTWVWRYDQLNTSGFRRYLTAFYTIFQTTSTIGFGDICAVGNTIETCIAILCLLCATLIQPFVIGNYVQILNDYDQKTEEFNKKISLLKDLFITFKQHAIFLKLHPQEKILQIL